LDDIKISEVLVADLKTQDKGVCPLDRRRGQVEKSGRCVAEEAPPRRVKQAKPERRERQVARAPQPTINGAPINQSEQPPGRRSAHDHRRLRPRASASARPLTRSFD
jgi:hypothetical protein